MRQLARFAGAAALGLAVAAGASGQTTGATTTGTTTTGMTGGTTSGTSGSGTTLGGNQASTNTFQAATQLTPATISGSSVSQGSGVNTSNVVGSYYANPLYQGRAGSTGNDAPGGFGAALFGNVGSSSSARVSGNTASRTSTASSTANRSTTGFGGTGGSFGTTGLGGSSATGGTRGFSASGLGNTNLGRNSSTNQTGGEIIPVQRPVAFVAAVSFPVPPVNVPRMQTDLRGVIDRSSMLSNPRGIEVKVEGNVVYLRGSVKDADESQTAEGVIRLTPGVFDVKNELKYP